MICSCKKGLIFKGILVSFLIVNVFTLKAQSKKPNVILILADDMGLGDVSALNGGLSKTPFLDQLMKESVWFTSAYSGSAVCAPSRAALLTGQYPHKTGVVSLEQKEFPSLTSLSKKVLTLGNLFTENGYKTGLVGKWHLGIGPAYHPMKRGFNEFVGFIGAPSSYFNYKLDFNGVVKNIQGEYLTHQFTHAAIDFIRRHKEEPFFLHLAHYAPHRPLEAPQQIVEQYLKKGFDKNTATIYAMIEIMDQGIGEVLKELDRLKISENTIVIFTSDNGPDPLTGERFNMNLKGRKYQVLEGGIHVPLMIRWPAKLQPRKTEQVFHFIDMVPTLAEFCKLKVSTTMANSLDGKSSAEILLAGKSAEPSSRALFWQWNRGVPFYSHNAAIRMGKWKLVRPPVTRDLPQGESSLKPVLYDIEKDELETNDVAASNPQVYDRLNLLLEEWCRRMEFERLSNTDY